MINFLIFLLSILFLFELEIITFESYDYSIVYTNIFLPYCLFIIFLNFYINSEKNTKLDLDLLIKFFLLIFKTPNFLFNYILNIFKKIYIFLFYFKYRSVLNTLSLLIKKYSNNLLLFWRPLFKKTSYFGYYRSNRSKWIK